MKKLIGHIGVDSGNIFIVDPCYIKNHPELFDDEKWGDFVKARHPTGKTIPAMPLFSGVVSHTNYGDGEYPVYVTLDDEGNPTKLEIDFVDDEAKEENSTEKLLKTLITDIEEIPDGDVDRYLIIGEIEKIIKELKK